jgi:hypothetical protein
MIKASPATWSVMQRTAPKFCDLQGWSVVPTIPAVPSVNHHKLYGAAPSPGAGVEWLPQPSDLPVEEATKYELAINLKCARAHSTAVAASASDEVIE